MIQIVGRRWRRFSQSLHTWWALTIASALLLGLWAFLDASFPAARYMFCIVVDPVSDVDPMTHATVRQVLSSPDSTSIQCRVYALGGLLWFGFVGIVGAAVCLWKSWRRFASGKQLAVHTGITLLIVSVFLLAVWRHKDVEWYGCRFRVDRQFSEFKRLAAAFNARQPQTGDVLPMVGRVVVDPEDPDRVVSYPRGYTWSEAPEIEIRRLPNCGCLRFRLNSGNDLYDCKDQANNGTPECIRKLQPIRTAHLEDGWYLVAP